MSEQSVVFVRHGQSLGNIAGVFLLNDRVNYLTPNGINQALGVQLPDGMEFTRFHASLNTRANQTLIMMLLMLKQSWDIGNVMLSDALNEALASETWDGVRIRSQKAISEINESLKGGGNVLVVSHNWIMADIFKVLGVTLPEDAVDRAPAYDGKGGFYNNYLIKHCYPIVVQRHVFDAACSVPAATV